MTVDPPAMLLECRRGQRYSRGDELLAHRFAPVFERGRLLRHMGSLMIFGQLRNLTVAALCALSSVAIAAPGDDAVLSAYDAYRAGDPIKLARHAKKLEGHVLTPWVDYWRIALRLEDTPAKDVHAFLEQNANTYVAEVLRGDWLRVVGQRGDWAEFARQLALYPRDDLEVRCYAALMSAERGQEARLGELDWIWLEPQELPDGCAKLVQKMLDEESITVTDVWRRVRLQFAKGQITAAKTALGYLDKPHLPDQPRLA